METFGFVPNERGTVDEANFTLSATLNEFVLACL